MQSLVGVLAHAIAGVSGETAMMVDLWSQAMLRQSTMRPVPLTTNQCPIFE